MTNQHDLDALLAAYADGERDEAAAAAVEAHMTVSPSAQRMLAVYFETTALLRAAFPESLYANGTAPPPEDRHFRRSMVSWFGRTVAASLLVGIIGYGTGAIWPELIESERDHLLSEVAEYHSIYSRDSVHLVEVPTARAEHLKAWLAKRGERKFGHSGFHGGRPDVRRRTFARA